MAEIPFGWPRPASLPAGLPGCQLGPGQLTLLGLPQAVAGRQLAPFLGNGDTAPLAGAAAGVALRRQDHLGLGAVVAKHGLVPGHAPGFYPAHPWLTRVHNSSMAAGCP